MTQSRIAYSIPHGVISYDIIVLLLKELGHEFERRDDVGKCIIGENAAVFMGLEGKTVLTIHSNGSSLPEDLARIIVDKRVHAHGFRPYFGNPEAHYDYVKLT